MRSGFLGLVLGLVTLLALPAPAAVKLPATAPECVQWAAADLDAALHEASLTPADVDVTVELASDDGDLPMVGTPVIPAEGFDLTVAGDQVKLAAGDPVGAMYGLLELAEQVRNGGARADWPRVAGTLHSTQQRPASAFRGDNAFIHTKPMLLTDQAMWRAYLDQLARCRFNVLDLHGGYDFTDAGSDTGFPNLYPLLVHVPEYPDVGDRKTQARNLAAFKQIVAYAKDRGIRVAFMNYKAKAPDLFDDELADYTAKAVAILLKEVPDLYMLGFRVGESGQKASFFEDAYLKGVADSGRKDLRIYTRSWLTSQKELARIAQACDGRLDIEIKYNGEHLGLPYHAIHGGHHSYSYQDYIRVGAPYQIIWQVRANGTHRFWAWENTAFIRRTVNTFGFGEAAGFTLEPHIAYFNTKASAYYESAADKKVYRWIWQKHWMWYFAWGRLAYDPKLPEATLVGEYRRHFGAQGPRIYQAMQQASVIVPLVYAHTNWGPDHRNISPETETGTGTDIFGFDRAALDARSFMGIREYVDRRVTGKPDGRVTPVRVARLLSDAASATRAAVDGVGELTGHAGDEWRLLKTDLLCASHLGDYHAQRTLGLVHLAYALKAGSPADYELAQQHLAASRAGWQALADVGDATYAPLLNKLRNQEKFRWASKLNQLARLDEEAAERWELRDPVALGIPGAAGAPGVPGAPGFPGTTAQPGRPLAYTPADLGLDVPIALSGVSHRVSKGQVTISCRVAAGAGVRKVVLWHKPLPSEPKWRSVAMKPGDEGRYAAKLKIGPEGMLYLIEVQTEDGQARNFPDVLQATPYWAISPQAVAKAMPAPAGPAAEAPAKAEGF